MPDRTDSILSLETSTAAGSVAVLVSAERADEKIVACNEWRRNRSHAEVTTPALEDAVKLAGGWNAIGALAVGIGPGSFTGIRVALNAARAAAWSLRLPLIPIRTTDALIEAARSSGLSPKERIIVAVLDAQMGMYFSAWELAEKKVTDPAAYDLRTLVEKLKTVGRSITLIGEAADAVLADLRSSGLDVHRAAAPHLDTPHALTVARLAARAYRESAKHLDAPSLVRLYQWQSTQPLYLRGSGAEEKMR